MALVARGIHRDAASCNETGRNDHRPGAFRCYGFAVQCAGYGGSADAIVDNLQIAIGACNIGRSASGDRQRFACVKSGNIHRTRAGVVEGEITNRSNNIGCPAAAADACKRGSFSKIGNIDNARTVVVNRQVALVARGIYRN